MPFRGVSDYRAPLLADQLEANLVSWLAHSFDAAGAYETVARGGQDPRAGDRSRLSVDADPRYPANRVWKAPRADWVWYPDTGYAAAPTVASGVWVNGTFLPANTGGTSPVIDFPRGRVFFSSGVSPTSVVQVAHSPRLVQVRRSDEPWFQSFGFNSFLAGGEQGQLALAENRVQLPVVLVEPAFAVSTKPLEIGSYANEFRTDYLLHCFAETPWERNRLHDILVGQADARVPTFDRGLAPPPLTASGAPRPSAMTHDQLAAAYPWRQARVEKVTSEKQPTPGDNLWWATVRWTVGVDNP